MYLLAQINLDQERYDKASEHKHPLANIHQTSSTETQLFEMSVIDACFVTVWVVV